MLRDLFHYVLTGRTMQDETPLHLGVEVLKGAPPAGFIGLHWLGISLADWVSLVMLVYGCGLLVQMFYRLGKWTSERRRKSGEG